MTPDDRALVERLIAAERRARIAEQALKDRLDHPEDRGLILLYQARIEELESIVQRLNDKITRKAS